MRKLFAFLAVMTLWQVPQAALAAGHEGDPHWIQAWDSKCWLFNPNPETGESVSWEGSCNAAGEATGAGKTTWFKYNQWHIVETGEMRGGRMEGWWERRWYAGRLEESLWQGGVKIAVQGPAQSPGYGNGQYNSRSDPGPSLGDRAMETLERQRRENCAAVAEGRNRGGCYGQ